MQIHFGLVESEIWIIIKAELENDVVEKICSENVWKNLSKIQLIGGNVGGSLKGKMGCQGNE